MIRLLLFSVAVTLALSTKAQINLVPNPSFEEYSECPEFTGDIYKATGWFSCRESPDYFHPCTPFAGLSVPVNARGHQAAKTGEAYAGLGTFFKTMPETREYLGVQLTQPLNPGVKYYCSFFVSRADTLTLDGATNNLGFRFSAQSYSETNPAPIDNFSHYHTDAIITDKDVWTKVSGFFVADSAYVFLMIGNFYNDANTDTIECASVAYYYIDDICVTTDSLYNEHWSSLLSLNATKSIRVYPSPATSFLFVESEAQCSVSVFYATGQLAVTDSSLSSGDAVDISRLPSGLYTAVFRTQKETVIKPILIVH